MTGCAVLIYRTRQLTSEDIFLHTYEFHVIHLNHKLYVSDNRVRGSSPDDGPLELFLLPAQCSTTVVCTVC